MTYLKIKEKKVRTWYHTQTLNTLDSVRQGKYLNNYPKQTSTIPGQEIPIPLERVINLRKEMANREQKQRGKEVVFTFKSLDSHIYFKRPILNM